MHVALQSNMELARMARTRARNVEMKGEKKDLEAERRMNDNIINLKCTLINYKFACM